MRADLQDDDSLFVVPMAQEYTHPYLKDDPTDPEDEDVLEVEKMEFYCVLFVVMLFFFVAAASNERHKWKVGHQTSFTIIFGVIIALFLWLAFGNKRTSIYAFK